MEAKTYTCPECGGTDKKWTYRNGRREPYVCGLCEGEKVVTLDQVMERVDNPGLYFATIIMKTKVIPRFFPAEEETEDTEEGYIPF